MLYVVGSGPRELGFLCEGSEKMKNQRFLCSVAISVQVATRAAPQDDDTGVWADVSPLCFCLLQEIRYFAAKRGYVLSEEVVAKMIRPELLVCMLTPGQLTCFKEDRSQRSCVPDGHCVHCRCVLCSL